ncbi:MAG: hypothetical protein Q8N45_10040, partial [Anaerolineales bacterium]|nr:hypothetical protein [Anaerolineales bacterium]
RVVALDTVDRLRSGAQRKTVIEVTLAVPDGQQEKRRIECDDGVEAAVQRALAETNGRRVLAVNTLRPSLEDVFVQLTGLNAEVMLAEKGGKGGGGNAGLRHPQPRRDARSGARPAGIDHPVRHQFDDGHRHRL